MTDPENAAELFHLDMEIIDPILVEWLREIPTDQIATRVEDTLRAGHFVLNLVQAAAGEEQMERYFRPVTDKMGRLEDILDEIMVRAQKSQRLGEIGEDLVVKQLRESFPGDAFTVVSNQSGEADIDARFALDPFPETNARVEVKLYSHDVPKTELDKFRRDLGLTGVRYGLMVSLASRLAGVRGPMLIEDTGDSTVVFLPNAGLDGVRLVAATAMLKAIILYHQRSSAARRVPAAAVERAWERVSAEIEQIEEIVRDVERFRASVRDAEAAMAKHMNGLADAATWIHAKLHTAVRNLTVHLRDELIALPTDGDAPALAEPTPPDDVLAALDRLEHDGDKRAATFRRLHELAAEVQLDIRIAHDGSWILLCAGDEIAHTAGTKTRLDVVFPVTGAKVELDPAIEKIKGDTLVVAGSSIDAMAARVGERLASLAPLTRPKKKKRV